MTVGAKLKWTDLGDAVLELPDLREDTTVVVWLPARADETTEVSELFIGGVFGWSCAIAKLAAGVSMRMDHNGRAMSMSALNMPPSQL